MLSLIYKDFYQSRKTILILLLVGTAFIFNLVHDEQYLMLSGFIFMIVYGFISRNEYNEDKNRGYTLLRTLPIKSSKIVVSKFLSAFLITLLSVIYSFTMIYLFNKSLLLDPLLVHSIFINALVVLLFSGLFYICVFRFGSMKTNNISRIFFFILFFAPGFLVKILKNNSTQSEAIHFFNTFIQYIGTMNLFIFLSFLAILYISTLFISIIMFKKNYIH